MDMDLAAALIDELRRDRRAHTIILYGSRARGDATPESDVDVAAFADVEVTTRDARRWHGFFLDGFVYPTALAQAPAPEIEKEPELLKLCGGRVLLDERGLAAPLLARLAALEREGPPALAQDEAQMRRVWARKMLARIGRGDLEARYRHHWLLYALLEDYHALRGVWYRGPKEAFAQLQRDSPATFDAFTRALAPGAPHDALAALVDHVVGDASKFQESS